MINDAKFSFIGLGDFAAAAASDFWSHPKVTKRWPVGRATESSFAQRGEAMRPSTTPHSSETQALIFSGCLYSSLIHPGPKARAVGHQNREMGARRECTGPGEHPRKKGSGERRHESAEKFPAGEIFRVFFGRRPRRRFGSFAAAGKGTRPAGRNIPSPVPTTGEMFQSPKGKGRALALHHIGFPFHGQRNKI